MNIYLQRYRNALRKAAKINRLKKKGYIVMHEGSSDNIGFVLEGKELLFKATENIGYLYYEHTPKFDHGYYTKIDDWNKKFSESFEVYAPEARVKL
jgi:hypothetical protein